MPRMDQSFSDFVHPRHVDAFLKAAAEFRCHILVRETGRASLHWCGRPGYTGKRGDMKAKTAQHDVGRYRLKGLVVSPEIHPGACKPKAAEMWAKSRHLVTIPPNGFSDDQQPRGCPTPYLLQTNPAHQHYGCVAWVENGLLTPRYVHGDYDLYAIVPAGQAFDPSGLNPRAQALPNIMQQPSAVTLAQRVAGGAYAHLHVGADPSGTPRGIDHVGPLSMRIATFLNLEIARTMPGLLGALMVNHGEQVNLGAAGQDYCRVLAFFAAPRQGRVGQVLDGRLEHEAFYRSA